MPRQLQYDRNRVISRVQTSMLYIDVEYHFDRFKFTFDS